ncbi:MAG: hypothetical protein WBC71_08365 [Salaquimonas sp.]
MSDKPILTQEQMKTVGGPVYGKSLENIGFNLLVTDVLLTAAFLEEVLEATIIRADKDFAIIGYGPSHFMLHHDSTYAENELLSILPEAGARGAGMELRFYETDPDAAEARAIALSDTYHCSVLRPCSDRPHGLRECFILSADGYCFVPSRHLND